MNTVHLTPKNVSECATRAVDVIRAGGVVVYPTDTLYGLGANALSDEAVSKICAIKGRDEGKPIHCIVADLDMAKRYAHLDRYAYLLAKAFLPGPLTLVLEKLPEVNTGIARTGGTIGIRIPRSEVCVEMARLFDGPITTTSANVSGERPERSTAVIKERFGTKAPLIDLLIDAGELPESLPSTVVDLSRTMPVILREGAIPAADIWNALRIEP